MKDILKDCHFVPMSTMKKVIELLETQQEFDPIDSYCKRNLVKLQQSKMIGGKNSLYYDKKFKTVFRAACCRAIYSHDWNKLLYLLKKCPPWEHDWKDVNEAALYVRALLILLMYHPSSQALGLFNDYLHLVWSCRSDDDKKAILKIMLTLPEKLQGVTYGRYNALGVPIAKAMLSEDGECIEWKYNVILDGPAEVWLLNLEHIMRIVLRDQLILTRAALRKCRYQREQWINDWPGQLGITCSKIQWTSDCTRTLARCDIMHEKKPLKKLRKKQNLILATLQAMSRKEIGKILRCKVNALCVIEIHSRDTVEKMYKMGCMTVSTFEWFSQLKFYWDREREDCYIRQTNTSSIYTYEYIGNSGRLVITPLTDRCYITLTTALNLFRGGSPQGPAGTGKTETVKDLGRALARWVVVTNCSDGLDYKAMSKTFAGIAQSGCWGCFDEFNRINIEVLSVVAQQILAVLLALSLFMKRFVFDGCDIKLDGNCGIFITMNPGIRVKYE